MQAENGRILLWNLLNNFIDVIAFDIGEFDWFNQFALMARPQNFCLYEILD